jgi:pyruvate formate lyase activating enzyme
MAEIVRDVLFYDQSRGGVTFTGGEPMLQTEFLREILSLCKEQHIHTAVDTSGHTSWENFYSILPLVDLFLYDVKLVDESRHKMYTSVSNKLILSNLRKLADAGAHIIVRIPLIPGINDDDENIDTSAEILAKLPVLEGTEVMPYHAIHTAKYAALGMEYKLKDLQPPTNEQVARAEDRLSSHGLTVIKNQGRAV